MVLFKLWKLLDTESRIVVQNENECNAIAYEGYSGDFPYRLAPLLEYDIAALTAQSDCLGILIREPNHLTKEPEV